MLRIIISLIVSCAVILAASSGYARTKIEDDTVLQAQKIKKKRYFFTKQLEDLKITGNVKHIPENTKVVVPYFRVTFAKGGKYLNSVGGVTTSKTKVVSSLAGVEPEIMQAITDAMYADLLGKLSEAGYEVQDISILSSNETYQKLQESSAYPVMKKDLAQFTPENRYFPGTIAVKAFMLCKDVDALMLKADYTVNFITLNANQKKFNILNDKSDVKVGQGINVLGELSVITEKGPVAFVIQQPIGSEVAFGEVKDATTTMNKVGDGVAFASSLLRGKVGDRHVTNTVEVIADPQRYKAAAIDALERSNSTLASFMDASVSGEKIEQSEMQE